MYHRFFTKPAYATLTNTRHQGDTPPHMEKILNTKPITRHQRNYISDFKLAATTLDHWCHHKYKNDKLTVEAINTWKVTCDNLTQNPFFTDEWDLPAFYPLYSLQCMAGMQDFFTTSHTTHPQRSDFWRKQLAMGDDMFTMWEKVFFHVAAPKHVPFPRCLWYHKYLYVHKKKQSGAWKSFFEGTVSFQEWGKTN